MEARTNSGMVLALAAMASVLLYPQEAHVSGSTVAHLDAVTFRLVADTRVRINFITAERERIHHTEARKNLERGLARMRPAFEAAVRELAAGQPGEIVFRALTDDLGVVHADGDPDVMAAEKGPVRFIVPVGNLITPGTPPASLVVVVGLERLPGKAARKVLVQTLKAAATKVPDALPDPADDPEPNPIQKLEPAVRGTITNAVHTGDPVQAIHAAGFIRMEDAARFAAAGFTPEDPKPVFSKTLKRGESLRFELQPYVVFYYTGPDGKPELLSITRCHGDLRLTVGSCGFQFLLGVDIR